MKLKTYPPPPQLGDTKIIIKFAWCPTRVEDSLIWLERYNEVWVYGKLTIRLIGGLPITGNMWKLESTNLIISKPGLPDFKNPPPAPKSLDPDAT